MTDYPNWFEYVQPNFEEFLTPLAGEIRLRFLQLGVYTGDATIWMCENILTSQSSLLDDVDTWQGSDEPAHEVMDFEDVYKTYLDKTADYQDGIIVHRKYTTAYLMDYRTREKEYDFIYIDADHTTVGVILDAELSWPLLKSGGIMAFDDYLWGHESGDPRLAPMVGIDLFLHRHLGDYELLTKNNQVWIRKH
jgi:predicted O-methyltransferase YrrM